MPAILQRAFEYLAELAELLYERVKYDGIVFQLTVAVELFELFPADGMNVSLGIAIAEAHAVEKVDTHFSTKALQEVNGTINGAAAGLGFGFIDGNNDKAMMQDICCGFEFPSVAHPIADELLELSLYIYGLFRS